MKKITYLLIAAMSVFSVASCVKEMTPELAPEGVTGQVFTVALPAATRTALVEGKTVWAEGDSLWVSNGAVSETVVVPAAAWGKKEFDFATQTVTVSEGNPQLFVVYPYTAAAGIVEGKLKVKIPYTQDGLFEHANIAAAVSTNAHVELRNLTALLKINVSAAASAPVYTVEAKSADGKAMTGLCSVDFSGEAPALTPAVQAPATAYLKLNGRSGDCYLSVIPGSYAAGFKLTAKTAEANHAREIKVSTVENTVNANDLVDLGVIGTNLQSYTAAPAIPAGRYHSTCLEGNSGENTLADIFFKWKYVIPFEDPATPEEEKDPYLAGKYMVFGTGVWSFSVFGAHPDGWMYNMLEVNDETTGTYTMSPVLEGNPDFPARTFAYATVQDATTDNVYDSSHKQLTLHYKNAISAEYYDILTYVGEPVLDVVPEWARWWSQQFGSWAQVREWGYRYWVPQN